MGIKLLQKQRKCCKFAHNDCPQEREINKCYICKCHRYIYYTLCTIHVNNDYPWHPYLHTHLRLPNRVDPHLANTAAGGSQAGLLYIADGALSVLEWFCMPIAVWYKIHQNKAVESGNDAHCCDVAVTEQNHLDEIHFFEQGSFHGH